MHVNVCVLIFPGRPSLPRCTDIEPSPPSFSTELTTLVDIQNGELSSLFLRPGLKKLRRTATIGGVIATVAMVKDVRTVALGKAAP